MLKPKRTIALIIIILSVLCMPLLPSMAFAASPSTPTPAELRGDCSGADLSKDCGIVEYLKLFINVLSGLVGVIIVIMITVGGIQYSAARDNPQAVVAARTRIMNAIIALVVFLFAYAFLQYIVPGGVL